MNRLWRIRYNWSLDKEKLCDPTIFSYRFTFLNCDLIGCKRVCRNESKYFKWLATKSGLLRECPVTWSTGHECIVSERDQTEDVCFTMYVYLTKLECIVSERDQTEDVCFTMYVYWPKHECIVSERDQTEDACFTMHVYLIKLENSLLLVLCIQQNVRFYLYPHWIIKYFLCMKNCGTRCFINNSHSTYNITAFLFIY